MNRARSLSFLILCAAAAATLRGEASAQELRITELMAAGQNVIVDEDGAMPDWIEIFNASDTAVELVGWNLTDDPNRTDRWTFPARTLPGGGYLLVFASGKNRAPAEGTLHTNFALKSGGEQVVLVRPDGTVAHVLKYPVQLPEVSFDGEGRFLSEPTPGAPNNGSFISIAIAPTFSAAHGFSDGPFDLTLRTATEGAQIRYTLDGTEPQETRGVEYTSPINIARTTVLRAAAFAPGMQPSPVVTQTYLFVEDIVRQSLNGTAPPGWPRSWGANRVDYGLDARITKRGDGKRSLRDGLRSIPSLSIVMDLEDLFDSVTGIYANPQQKDREWERPMSLELIPPSGSGGFQINGGLRIRGGASRDTGNPKHSFRVLFRKEYGAPELTYPLFGPEGAESTARFDIRCEQLIAWHYFVDKQADFLRDLFGRETQGALGQPYKRGDFYHLYINGQYWGLYQTDERISAEYGAAYFGGNDDDYDIVKFDAESSYGTGFIDGTFGSWTRLFEAGARGFTEDADYFKIQGLNPDGSRNRSYERLLDVDNLIDYMLAGIFIAADDTPPSFGTQNNWYGLRSRKDEFGFRFFAHDWEISMADADEDRVGPAPDADPFAEQTPGTVNPWHFWQALRLNPEFRQRVADHVQRFFFHGGPLTVEAATERWRRRMEEIDLAVLGESARWGDARNGGFGPLKSAAEIAADWLAQQQPAAARAAGDVIIIDPPPGPGPRPGPGGGGPKKNPKPFTRDDWLAAADERVLQGYLQTRTGAVLQHLKDGGLLPAVSAPEIEPFGGPLPAGATVTISAPPETAAEVFYTTDGSDPRRIGGALAASAQTYSAPFELAKRTILKARAKIADEWSALVEVEFIPGIDYRPLRLTEIHYHPPPGAVSSSEEREFLELKNTGAVPLDLGGFRFTAGINFTFPEGSVLVPDQFFVLARNAAAFSAEHGGLQPNGVFTGQLGDDADTLTLVTGSGAQIFSIRYDDETPWPLASDGLGFSLVRSTDEDPDEPESWRASASPGGSPGSEDPPSALFPRVVVNELLAYPAAGQDAAVELLNLDAQPADVSGWLLANGRNPSGGFRIPAGATIPSGGTIVLTASQLSFGFSPAGGEIWLFATTPEGSPAGYQHGFEFGASRFGHSFGRHVNSEGDEQFPIQSAVTLGTTNEGPLLSAGLRISEVHYFPRSSEDEFVEIENLAADSAVLDGARLVGMAFVFTEGANIPGNGRGLVVTIDPVLFRARYGVPAEVPIFGPASSNLQNDGERLALEIPVVHEGSSGFVRIESLRYNDRKPWPTAAAGFGASLQRIRVASYADDPTSWRAGEPSPGQPNRVNAPPRIQLTAPLDRTTVLPPQRVIFAASAEDPDGSVTRVEFLVDSIVVGEDSAAPFSFEWIPAPGLHDLNARAIDDAGVFSESDFVTVDVDAPENGAGSGVRGEYFANPDLAGDPIVREDAAIDFDWAEFSPMPELPRGNYSTRWTGKLLPRKSGEHTFVIQTGGGVRLFINEEMVIDAWDEPIVRNLFDLQTTVVLTAGELVDLRVEYIERDGFGFIKLLWAEAGEFETLTIPQTQLYLPNQDPSALGIASGSDLAPRRIGRIFQTRLQAVNGTRPYAWSAAPTELPAGISLRNDGLLQGAPEQPGSFRFAGVVQDSAGQTARKVFRLLIIDPEHPEFQPSVTILAPKPRTVFGDENVSLRGRAAAPRGLAELRYSVNGGIWHRFPANAVWQLTVDAARGLQAGFNQVQIVAIDVEGRESTEAAREFERIVQSPLRVTIEGSGRITPGFSGETQRIVGRNYTITAHPDRGFVFQEWRGAFQSDRKLTFQMTEGLELTAVFAPSPFIGVGRTFTGLIGADTTEHATRGTVTIRLNDSGAFTGQVHFAGKRYVLRGRFAGNGSYFTDLQSEDGVFRSIAFQLRSESGDIEVRISQTQDDFYLESLGIAHRADFNLPAQVSPFAGVYRVSLADPDDTGPLGTGVATLTVRPIGRFELEGKLGDETALRTSGWMRRDGVLPVYLPLYGRGGSISGELIIAGPENRGTGALRWINGESMPAGFNVNVEVVAEPAVETSDGALRLNRR